MPQLATSTGCLHGLACCGESGEGAGTATSTGGHHDYRYDDYYYHYYYDSHVGRITLF